VCVWCVWACVCVCVCGCVSVCVCVCVGGGGPTETRCFNRSGKFVAKFQDKPNETYRQHKCKHALFIPLLLSSSYCPKWTFASLMAFFHSFIFLDIFLQRVIFHPLISVQTHSHHLDLSFPLLLTSSGWLFKFCLTFPYIRLMCPLQFILLNINEGSNVHVFIQSP